jgi:hypothetical protein
MTTLAAVRFKNLSEKRSKENISEDDTRPLSPASQQPLCNRCHRAFDFSRAPDIVCGNFLYLQVFLFANATPE